MKKTLATTVLLGAAALTFALPMPMMGAGLTLGAMGGIAHSSGGTYAKAEIAAVETELGPKTLGEVTFDQIAGYETRIATAAAKDLYVATTAGLSAMLPGAGQFRMGEGLEGTAFLTAHIGVIAGTMAGMYYLLPSDLRFDRMNPFTGSMKTVHDAWSAHSLSDLLPALGVAAAGVVVDSGIRIWSASAAQSEAKAAIDSGRIKPEPLIGPNLLGMRFRY